tara:strand:+ start:5720 stop:5959 length:240 start_codon:yes stop_codon:yes gene_type:complete
MSKTKTIELQVDDVWLDIEYDYTEEEPEITYYSDGSGHPGSPAKVDIYKVKAGGVDISEIISDYVYEEIETMIHKIYED